MMEFGHIEYAIVRTHEVDKDKKMHVPSMLMLMQEASMQNVLKLKASVWDMEEDNISWVLLRKELVVKRRPLLGESIQIETYPAGFDRVFAYRDYWMRDESGNVLATAGSTWTLLNTQSRTMERIPKKFYSFHPEDHTGFLERPKSKILMPQRRDFVKTYEIGYYDLDWNGHVNNNILSKLVLQSTPEEFAGQRSLARMDIHIKAETFLGEELCIWMEQISSEETLHCIQPLDENRTILIARCNWKKKGGE